MNLVIHVRSAGTAASVNGQHDPALHALSVEPRVARPGATVLLRFRTPNLGPIAIPDGLVRFLLPPALEALGDPVVPTGETPPGSLLEATLAARVHAFDDDREACEVQALLELPDRHLSSNLAHLVVRALPVLDGPASGTWVEPLDDQTVVVRARIVNEGDGPARDVVLTLVPPRATVPDDPAEPRTLTLARLDAGATADLAYRARIVAPACELVADDAIVERSGGVRVALTPRGTLALCQALAEPVVDVVPARRGIAVTIDVPNAGWSDARDVALRVALTPGVRLIEGTLEVDGIPVVCRQPRAGTPLLVTLARVAAREHVRVTFNATLPRGFIDGMLGAGIDGHDVHVPFAAQVMRDVRLRIVETAPCVAPATTLDVIVAVCNAGDARERVQITCDDGEQTQPRTQEVNLGPGASTELRFAYTVPSGLNDGDWFTISVVASDESGERARAEQRGTIRERAWLVADEPPTRRDGEVHYVVRNAGTTTAREVQARIGNDLIELAPIVPGERARLRVAEIDARGGVTVMVRGRHTLTLAPLDDRPMATVAATLRTLDAVLGGAAFALRASLTIEDAVEELIVRARDVAGTVYVAGSTTLDGRALLDRADGGPLAGSGLVLRGIPAKTNIEIGWSLRADPMLADAVLTVEALLVVDGQERSVEPLEIPVHTRDGFAARPVGLGYHVDACAAQEPAQLPARSVVPVYEPIAAEDDENDDVAPAERFAFALTLDADRRDALVKALRGADGGTLAAHVLALRTLLPQRDDTGDTSVAHALEDVRRALADVFDRLFVKLRIPGFVVAAADLEDPALRRALVTFFSRLAQTRAAYEPLDGALALVESDRVPRLLASFADAPFGAPEALRALVALMPRTCDDDPLLGAALDRYAGALDAALARWERRASAFDDALAHTHDDALDDARAAVLSALRAHVTVFRAGP